VDTAYFIFYHTAMVLSLLVSSFVAVLAWQRRRVPGAAAMVALAVSTFIWTLGFLCEANSDTLEQQLFFSAIGYLGSMSTPVAWFLFAMHYTTDNRRITGWKIIPFCIVPLVTVILVWTNSLHHLMWSGEHLVESGLFIVTAKTYGPFFWVALAYNYILILAGAIILIRRLFVGARLYTQQAISLIIAVSLPLLWNIIYVFNLIPLPRKDLTPVMFAISGAVIVLGVMRFQLLSAVPFARKFLIQHLSDGVMAFDMSNRLLEANPMAFKIFGLDSDVIGKRIENIPSLLPIARQLSSANPCNVELTLMVSEEERFYELEVIPTLDNHKQQIGWLAILRDITERKRQEMEYRTVIQITADGFWLVDMQGRFLDVNDAYCQMIGYSRSELLAMSISDIEANETPEEISMHIARIENNGKDRFETRHRHKDGSIIDIEVSMNYIEFGGKRMVGFIRDISERKKMQEQIIAQDRLASIGQLTAGIAHELNNPLTSVVGFSELLQEQDLPDRVKEDLAIIHNEAKRASRIVYNLLTFVREHPEGKALVDINEVIRKTLELRASEQKINNIQTMTHLASDLPEIPGSAFQLQQVFLNIIINAEYFMLEAHNKGILTIVTEKAGDFIRVTITDDGPGIPPENMKHIFSPFFTTKAVGKGTGLGLSICHGIITEHGGSIRAESILGRGAAFIIELPAHKGDDIVY
jgi:PAS domain S-box-containing protein